MIIHERKYVKPSREARVLSILEALSLDSGLSQQELGQRSFLSGAMVNGYLKEMQREGLITFVPENSKSYRYELTEKGEMARRSMFAAYAAELVRLYSALKGMVLDKLRGLEERGILRLALFGASETCEVALSALRDSPFTIVAVFDSDEKKHGAAFHGQIIRPPSDLARIDCQAVVATSFGYQDEICRQIARIAAGKSLEVVRL